MWNRGNGDNDANISKFWFYCCNILVNDLKELGNLDKTIHKSHRSSMHSYKKNVSNNDWSFLLELQPINLIQNTIDFRLNAIISQYCIISYFHFYCGSYMEWTFWWKCKLKVSNNHRTFWKLFQPIKRSSWTNKGNCLDKNNKLSSTIPNLV